MSLFATKPVDQLMAEGVDHGQSGELKQADPHMCVWLADDKLENRFAAAADALEKE